MKLLVTCIFCFLLTGCTLGNINSLYRSSTLKHGDSHIVDAKQRFVLTYPGLVKYNSHGEVIRTQTISCAEPSPDVFSVFAASGEASVSKGGASGAGSFATTETGASLIERTTALQALRDAYFRLCEAYGNGMIDEIDFMVGQRHNQTALMGLLAIEEMNALAKRPAVVIGGSASATSASGIQEIAKAINAALEENAEYQEKTDAKKQREKEINDALPEARNAVDAESNAPANESDEAKKERMARLAAAEKRVKSLEDEQNEIATDIKALQGKIATNEKLSQALVELVKSGGATGATARSIMQEVRQEHCKENCNTQQQEIAKQMVEVVKQVDDNDFGPTICLSYLRKASPANLPRYAVDGGSTAYASQICKDLLDEYVAQRKARRQSQAAITNALAERINEIPPDQLVELLGAVADNSGNGQGNIRNARLGRDWQVFGADGNLAISETLQALLLELQLEGGDKVKD